MTHTTFPNLISSARMVGAMCLLLLDFTPQILSGFWGIYTICGVSDIADGYLARKLKSETKAGALLDSVADLVFVVCCAVKLIPLLNLPQWMWIWIGVIAAIKVINQMSALVVRRRLVFPHTLANKLSGLFLFVSVPLFVCLELSLPLYGVAGLATFAAIQEGHIIRSKSDYAHR